MLNIAIPTNVKHTLKDLRVRSGLSQEEAASMLDVTAPTLRKWENDSADLPYSVIEKVEKIYSIPKDYIFFGTNNAFSEKIK
ncbi:helix-turn-helix domain-containing protein [Latilactobacillus sakei]|uniref:helix-turn-helix domain-containing protein n=1 Tax=Latilactobacillus sakei TaxID=1599 RepID=UPI000C13C451|nr:helix-turn-helix transcriptional regulator [Latilactobacillus sakei]SOB42714.1 Phage-related Cro-like protein [Latilactobacillus sakei]